VIDSFARAIQIFQSIDVRKSRAIELLSRFKGIENVAPDKLVDHASSIDRSKIGSHKISY